MTTKIDPLITYKDYMKYYNISVSTAKRYLTQDKKRTTLLRFTQSVFNTINGVSKGINSPQKSKA